MEDRLKIAGMIAAGIFSGVPYGLDDFEQTHEMREEEKKTTAAIARLSLQMAGALIDASTNYQRMEEVRDFKFMGLDVSQLRFVVNYYRLKSGDQDMSHVPSGIQEKANP